ARAVVYVGWALGHVAQRIDLEPGAPGDAARAVHGAAPEPVPRSAAEAVPSEGVELARPRLVQGHAEVPHRHDVLLEAVPPVVIRLVNRVALDHHLAQAVDGVRDAGAGVLNRISVRPVGWLAVEEFAEQGQRAATELQAPAAVH